MCFNHHNDTFVLFLSMLLGKTEVNEVHKTVSATSSVLTHEPWGQRCLLVISCEIAHSDGSDEVIERAKINIETGTMYIHTFCTLHV